jgi:hypothetical protein
MSGHEQPELTGADQGHQSDGFLPIWGWWLLALGVAVVTTASLWFARIFHYYAKENPSGIKGLHVGDPPIPFQSTQDKAVAIRCGCVRWVARTGGRIRNQGSAAVEAARRLDIGSEALADSRSVPSRRRHSLNSNLHCLLCPHPGGDNHAFLRRKDAIADLGTLGGRHRVAWGIND